MNYVLTNLQTTIAHAKWINCVLNAHLQVQLFVMKGIASQKVLVLIVTIHRRKHINSFEKLIALLASSDLTFSIMQIFNSVPLLWTCKWIYGRVNCKLIKRILTLDAILALELIVVIAAERYFAIVKRFNRSRGHISLHILLTFCVLFSVARVIPMAVVIDTKEEGVSLERWSDRSS